MPSISKTLGFALFSSAAVQAFPRPHIFQRQEAATPVASPVVASPVAVASSVSSAPAVQASAAASAGGLSDIDILQFALTLEHLETEFYSQGFQKFPASDFMALGLTQDQITTLTGIGTSEATHVQTLMTAISAAGAQPVQACTYNFGFTDAAGMVATARVLEAVGVSAYLGAAPLVTDKAILGVAATIATVESRHQSFIRAASAVSPAPGAFDTPLGPRAVFTLAAQFIQSCPSGSNLNVAAFPAIALTPGTATIGSGRNLVLQGAAAPSNAQFCGFINQATPQFTPLQGGTCVVPPNLAGETYMVVTSGMAIDDASILAGPSVLQPS